MSDALPPSETHEASTRRTSYTESHKDAQKGELYDEHYETDPQRQFWWSREQRALCDIIDRFLPDTPIRLLDFACGTGRIAGFLEDRVETSVGVDVSASMLDKARTKLRRTELIEADITRGDVLGNRRFNLITAFRFFLNAEPELRSAAMAALARLLDRDGYLVFNNHRNGTSPLVRWKYRRRKRRNFMTLREMYDLADAAGLEIVTMYPIHILPLPGIRLPTVLNQTIEGLGAKWRRAKNYCECPIAVCRRSGAM